jgi:hypothetical protein
LCRSARLLLIKTLDDGVDLIGRGDVLVGRQPLFHDRAVDTEFLDEIGGIPRCGIATAHPCRMPSR